MKHYKGNQDHSQSDDWKDEKAQRRERRKRDRERSGRKFSDEDDEWMPRRRIKDFQYEDDTGEY